MLKAFKREEIDDEKWDSCVSGSYNAMIYGMSWYLDIVADNWEGIVLGDYDAVMPLPFRRKFGVLKYIYQPCFTQQLGIYSKKEISQHQVFLFIENVYHRYKYVNINLNKAFFQYKDSLNLVPRNNFLLDLKYPYEVLKNNFSNNAKLNIKRSLSYKLNIKNIENPLSIIKLFDENQPKYSIRFTWADYKKLIKIINFLSAKQQVELIGVYNEEGVLCAGAVFFTFLNRKIFIFSGSNQIARKQKMMFFLFDQFIRKNSDQGLILDFEGSNDPGLANFYSGFASENEEYPMLKFNRLPWFVKLFKR